MPGNGRLLEVRDAISGYGPKDVLHGVSLHVNPLEVVALIGLNGVGKSTLLKTIMRYLPLRDGSLIFDNKDISQVETDELISRGVSWVPQEKPVFPDMTVAENLSMGAWLIRRDTEKHRVARQRVFDLFPRLKERQDQKAGTLSGGERQMLAIGRAIMTKPKLLLMDEPSLGLMPKLVGAIFETVREIRDQGTAILLVEQNVDKALACSDRGYLMSRGAITFEGTRDELLDAVLHKEDLMS